MSSTLVDQWLINAIALNIYNPIQYICLSLLFFKYAFQPILNWEKCPNLF